MAISKGLLAHRRTTRAAPANSTFLMTDTVPERTHIATHIVTT